VTSRLAIAAARAVGLLGFSIQMAAQVATDGKTASVIALVALKVPVMNYGGSSETRLSTILGGKPQAAPGELPHPLGWEGANQPHAWSKTDFAQYGTDTRGWHDRDTNYLGLKAKDEWLAVGYLPGELENSFRRAAQPLRLTTLSLTTRGDPAANEGFEGWGDFSLIESKAPRGYFFGAGTRPFSSPYGELVTRHVDSEVVPLTRTPVADPQPSFVSAVESAEQFKVGGAIGGLGQGLRWSYGVGHDLAPYVGALWLRRPGETSEFPQLGGGLASELGMVFGVRLWF